MPFQLTLEIEREADGRFLAEVLELPGVAGRDDTREGAIVRAEALALRALAARLEAGEATLGLADIFQIADASGRETAYLSASEPMKRRLLEAIARDGEGAISLPGSASASWSNDWMNFMSKERNGNNEKGLAPHHR